MHYSFAAKCRLERAVDWATALSPRQAAAASAIWLAAVVVADASTSRLMSFNTFYLLPLCFIAWTLGLRMGLLAGLFCTVTTLTINGFGDGMSAQASRVPVGMSIWNATLRIGAVIFIVVIVAAFRRTHDRERAHARIDPLTGLHNRRSFEIEMRQLTAQSVRHSQTLLLAFIDLDNFKAINDRHGHNAGDQVLQSVGRSLRGALRSYDLAARLGGDEFAFAVLADDADAARQTVKRLHERLSQTLGATAWPTTCSMGAVAGRAKTDEDLPIRLADRLMYEAKAQGRDSWRFTCLDAERRLAA